MIKQIIPDNDGKIEAIKLEINGYDVFIEVKVFFLFTSINPQNIGAILEKYNSNYRSEKKFIKEHYDLIANLINKVQYPFNDFIPDSLFCFYPVDPFRRKLLKCFSNKLISHVDNIKLIDFSSAFLKKDARKSIKRDGLTKNEFYLKCPNGGDFKNLLVIDDVIDEGKTINILIELLSEKGLINQNTIVKMICLYNRPKSKKFDYSKMLTS
jgi:hypothetical protein